MKEIIAGIELFNKADFFAAHDFFEDCWLNCEREERFFYQGLVQVSVGCYHLVSGNFKGASSQLKKGTEKLKRYDSIHKKINLDSLIHETEVIIDEIKNCSKKDEPSKFWKLIPRIKIVNKFSNY